MMGRKQLSDKTSKGPLLFRNWIRFPIIFLSLIGIAFGLIYSFLFDPMGNGSAVSLPCVFHEVTGLYCPGCGDTRALHALVHGDFASVIDYNVLFPIMLLFLIYAYFLCITTLLFKRRVMWMPQTMPYWVIVLIVVLLVGYTVLRNIPISPFTWLAP